MARWSGNSRSLHHVHRRQTRSIECSCSRSNHHTDRWCLCAEGEGGIIIKLRETCLLQDSAMDVRRCIKTPREWLGVVCTLLLFTESVLCDGADWKKEQECYNYAGGHVYPGEAFRVPVSDHSLHLSKAKSAFRAFMHMRIICMLNALIIIKICS